MNNTAGAGVSAFALAQRSDKKAGSRQAWGGCRTQRTAHRRVVGMG